MISSHRPGRALRPALLLVAASLGLPTALAQTPPVSPPQAAPSTPAPPAVTPAQAQAALEVLQDDRKRAELIDTLRTIAAAAPGAATPAPAATATPAAAEAAATAAATAPTGSAQVLAQTSDWLGAMSHQLAHAARVATDFHQIKAWVNHVATDPETRDAGIDMLWKLGVVIAASTLAYLLIARLLRRSFAALERGAARIGRRGMLAAVEPVEGEYRDSERRTLRQLLRGLRLLPLAVARLAIELLPVGAFAVVGNLLLGTPLGSDDTTRLVVLAIVTASVLCLGVMCCARAIVSPDYPRLRLVPLGDESAAYIEIWVRRIAVLVVFGTAIAEVALLLGLAPAAHDALIRVVGFVTAIFAVLMVFQSRRSVAAVLRAPPGAGGPIAVTRNRLAEIWHVAAVLLIAVQWFVWATHPRESGFELAHYVVLTIAVLAVARLIAAASFGAFDRMFRIGPDLAQRLPGIEARANRYYPVLHGAVGVLIAMVAVLALFEVWGVNAFAWFAAGSVGSRALSAAITIAVTSLIAAAAWEAINLAVEVHMAQLRAASRQAQAARWQTLLPMLRTVLLVVVLGIVALTALSEVGINIGPLLAGAGIIGIAVGFGSQKLVQDLITGIFLLLENAMQVGDMVTVSGLSGNVEHLSIRTMRLRAGDGSVHIIPFSAVTSVTNTNRGIGNASVSVSVGFEEDTDRVSDVLRQIAAELYEDPDYRDVMRGELDLWGVDKVDGAMVTIAGQIVCTDQGRWKVQREFNRRMKKKFQELGITIYNPAAHMVLVEPIRHRARDADPALLEKGAERRS